MTIIRNPIHNPGNKEMNTKDWPEATPEEMRVAQIKLNEARLRGYSYGHLYMEILEACVQDGRIPPGWRSGTYSPEEFI